MKRVSLIAILLVSLIFQNGLNAQVVDSTKTNTTSEKMFVVKKNDGVEYIGKILKNDEREVLIETSELGKLYIPKHQIEKIIEISPDKIKNGVYTGNETYSTRYFLTTNGLPIEKGENYVMISLYGPEVQVALDKNLSVGGMTTWVGVPIVGSIKKSFKLDDNVHMAVGVLAGSGSWALPSGLGILGYTSITFGNRKANLTLSAGGMGIAAEGESFSSGLLSVSGMAKMGPKVTFVGDSFIAFNGDGGMALLIPGLRFSRRHDRAFQIGFAGIITEGEVLPVAIPMLGWFMKL